MNPRALKKEWDFSGDSDEQLVGTRDSSTQQQKLQGLMVLFDAAGKEFQN